MLQSAGGGQFVRCTEVVRFSKYITVIILLYSYADFTIQSLLKLPTLLADTLLNTSIYRLECIQGGTLFTSELCPPPMLWGGTLFTSE